MGTAPGCHKREFLRAQHIPDSWDQFAEVCELGTPESTEMEEREGCNPEKVVSPEDTHLPGHPDK